MSALAEELRAVVAAELAPLRQEVAALRLALEQRDERLEPLPAITGQSVRAAAAYERRHPEIAQLAVMVGRRRMYRRSEVLVVMRGTR